MDPDQALQDFKMEEKYKFTSQIAYGDCITVGWFAYYGEGGCEHTTVVSLLLT